MINKNNDMICLKFSKLNHFYVLKIINNFFIIYINSFIIRINFIMLYAQGGEIMKLHTT
jgi:hypothetical protein